jgi:putative membrane protein
MKKLVIVSTIMAAACAISLQAHQSKDQQGQSSQGGQGSQGMESSKGEKGSWSDSKFIQKAAEANLTEVQLGKLGTQKAQNQQVKQFAQSLQTDHQKANAELKTLAQQKGMQFPQKVDQKEQKEITKLQGLSGADFDKQFTLVNLKAHGKTISLYQKEVQQGQDPATKQYAQNLLPSLQHHLTMAENAAKSAGVSQTQITAILSRYPRAMGGTGTPTGREQGTGSSQKSDQSSQKGQMQDMKDMNK